MAITAMGSLEQREVAGTERFLWVIRRDLARRRTHRATAAFATRTVESDPCRSWCEHSAASRITAAMRVVDGFDLRGARRRLALRRSYTVWACGASYALHVPRGAAPGTWRLTPRRRATARVTDGCHARDAASSENSAREPSTVVRVAHARGFTARTVTRAATQFRSAVRLSRFEFPLGTDRGATRGHIASASSTRERHPQPSRQRHRSADTSRLPRCPRR